MRPISRSDFTIAIICALSFEADAVEALFDETFDRLSRFYGRQLGDTNAYFNGRIGKHNVVLCSMPGMGKESAASVASTLRISYTGIQLALVVGICGGAPSPSPDRQIYLGDVVISDSVVAYDFGRQYPSGFERKTNVKDTLGRPKQEIRSLLNGLSASRSQIEFRQQMLSNLHTLQREDKWEHPGATDILFEASYLHKHQARGFPFSRCRCSTGDSPDDICDEALEKDCHSLMCDQSRIIRQRSYTPATKDNVSVHIGTIASADTVMKSAEHRDAIIRDQRVFGFEIEAAGVWDNISCIIIKGVCDYADSHKNKKWQHYAAATGASAAKVFLEYWKHHGTYETVTDDRIEQSPSLGYPAKNENARRQRTARDDRSNPAFRPRTLPSSDIGSVGSGASHPESSSEDEMDLLPKGSKAPNSSTDTWPAIRPERSPCNAGTNIFTSTMPQTEDNVSDSLWFQADLLFHEGQWDELVDHMQTLIEKTGPADPNYIELLGMMGLALLFCSGRETRARVFLRKAKQTSKETRQVGLNYLLSRAYFRQNKNEQGSACSNQALDDLSQESVPNQAFIFEEGYNLGLILLRNPRTKPEGRELLKHVQQQCDRLQPQNPVGLNASRLTALDSLRAW